VNRNSTGQMRVTGLHGRRNGFVWLAEKNKLDQNEPRATESSPKSRGLMTGTHCLAIEGRMETEEQRCDAAANERTVSNAEQQH
jgi:hypothetical protein